jgi:trimethyllysine dioxygenase
MLKSAEPMSRKVIWGSKMVQSPPTVKYTDVMSGNDSGVYQWLSNIVGFLFSSSSGRSLTYWQDRFGFSFVSGVPVSPEATEELSTRIGFVRETQCMNGALPLLLESDRYHRWQVLGVYFRHDER